MLSKIYVLVKNLKNGTIVKKPPGINHLTYPKVRAKSKAKAPKKGIASRATSPGEAAIRKQKLDAAETVKTGTNGMKKTCNKSNNTCKVTFRLPHEAVRDAQSVCIVGDFNNWNIHANPLKRCKDGS